MVKSEKTNLYLLSIVGIVAVVGVVVLLLNVGRVPTQVSEEDLVGLATSSATCTDTDGGFDYLTKGTISGGTWKTTGATYADKTDSCVTSGRKAGMLLEGFCSDSTHGFYVYKSCATVVGAGYVCYDGACALDSDSDTVPDSLDVCEKGDDTIDSDSDGTPDCAEFPPVCGDDYCSFYETYSTCSDDCNELTDVTLANWPDMFIEDDEFTALLVVGVDARAEDVIAIMNIAISLRPTTAVTGLPLSISAVYLDSEIDDPYAQDLILVGTQCDNDIINEVLGYDEETCAESIQDEGTAIIKLLVTDSNKILIVSGYAATDTRYAGTFMSDEDYYSSLEGAEVVIDTSDEDSMSVLSTEN